MTALTEWQNFYVILGSSAGALIGLQFVAIALIAEMPYRHGVEQAGHAFATPTIVHFGAVLLLAGILSAPWHAIASAAGVWGLMALAGVVYVVIVARRMKRQPAYLPEFEDWLFHVLLPFAVYATLAISAFAARSHARGALFAVAGAIMLLLFIGIHNAWDAVTYHIFVSKPQHEKADAPDAAPE